MAVPRIVLDGTMGYGVIIGTSGTITINAVAYIVNNWQVTRGVQEAKDYKADGGVGRQRKTADFDTFSCELQLATGSTAYPKFGDSFSVTCDDQYGPETWYCDPVSVPQTNDAGAIRVVPLTGSKAYNGAPTVVN